MMRFLVILLLGLAGLSGPRAPAMAEEARVAALVIAIGTGAARADAVQASLQAMGAETLRANDPNNAELRSLLMRFADAAETRTAALVYLDAPIVGLGRRDFVLPAGTRLRRASDLLTRALPLSAFARATAVAADGGAVFVASARPTEPLPDGVRPAQSAPEARLGASPIVLATADRTDALVRVLANAARAETVDLGALIGEITADPGTSVSAPPEGRVYLRRPAAPTPEAEPEAEAPQARIVTAPAEPPAGSAAPAASGTAPDGYERRSVDVLAALEQALSRSAKRRLQQALRTRGFYSGFIDGIFGAQTRAAIEAYQRAEGLAVTGYLTQEQILRLQ